MRESSRDPLERRNQNSFTPSADIRAYKAINPTSSAIVPAADIAVYTLFRGRTSMTSEPDKRLMFYL